MLLLAVALMTYALQVVVLLAVYAVFANSGISEDDFSTKAFGVAVLASTAVWMVGLIRVAKRERIPLYDLERVAAMTGAEPTRPRLLLSGST